ncbi:MAG: COG4223 family protein [Henriciella sp.]
MSDPSLNPSSGDEAPIDAEFEPAAPPPKESRRQRSGPGWIAFSGLAVICLGLSAYSAGLIPGMSPDSAQFGAVEANLDSLSTSQTEAAEITDALTTDIAALKSRADGLQADRTRLVTELRAVRDEIETLESDISTLQRARIAGLAEADETDTPALELPDLSAMEGRVTALEDTLVTQLGSYDSALELLKARLSELETQAQAERLTSASDSNARTEAALALSSIEAAARRGRPFLTAQQKLATAMPGNQAIERLATIAPNPVPTIADLQSRLPALIEQALDQDALNEGTSQSWMRRIFGDGIQVRRTGEVTTRDQLTSAEAALNSGDLAASIAQVRAIDADLQPVFTDWLNNADDRLMLEQTLEALRLTMIAEERP